MHTDVDVVHACGLSEILFKVLHMCNKQFLLAGEVLVDFPVFIEYMNDYDLLLLLAAGFLEAVMYASLPVYTSTWQIRRHAAAHWGHASTSLLLLQVLRAKVA